MLLGKHHLAISALMKRLRLIRQGAHSLSPCITVREMICEELNVAPRQDVQVRGAQPLQISPA